MASTTSTPLVVGVDIGLTGMKAVAFDLEGNPKFESRERSPQDMPHPHWVERDGREFWGLFCQMLRTLTDEIEETGGYEIISIGISAHGDGIWLVDENGDAVRPGILSLDTRAIDIAAELNRDHGEELLRVTGQTVGPPSPGAILKWLQINEPESLEKAAYFILASDFLTGMLTNTRGTDITSASQAFTDVNTQTYTDEAFEIYGLEDLRSKTAPIHQSTDVVGTVHLLASRTTGLPEGLPVVAGLHDVDAGAIGAGAVRPGQMAVMAGTWSINEVISDHPAIDPQWFCRAFVNKGTWMNMSISPAASSNLEWFIQNLAQTEADVLSRMGQNPYSFVDYEISKVEDSNDFVTFIPYLYGNPMNIDASGTFAGIRAWHNRGHLLRGIYEGIAFNHRDHCDPLIDRFDVDDIRVVGGVAQSKLWPQIFADTLGRPISIPIHSEGGALGTAMVAAVGAGAFDSLDEAGKAMGSETRIIEPTPEGTALMNERYARYRELVDGFLPWWANAAQ